MFSAALWVPGIFCPGFAICRVHDLSACGTPLVFFRERLGTATDWSLTGVDDHLLLFVITTCKINRTTSGTIASHQARLISRARKTCPVVVSCGSSQVLIRRPIVGRNCMRLGNCHNYILSLYRSRYWQRSMGRCVFRNYLSGLA